MSATAVSVPGSPAARRDWLAVAVRRLLLMAVALVIALVIAELVLRLFHLAPAQGVATVNARQFARVPGMFAPHQHVRDLQKPALPYVVTIDSLGFRGAEFTRAKPANQLRVVMVGDSYVYGDFVDDDQTFPAQLERQLRRACGGALVINAGLGGTTIVDQAPMLQRALPLAPDVVVLVYVVDDIANLEASKSDWDLLAENRERKSQFPLSVVYPIVHNTALWNLALRVRATSLIRAGETSLSQDYSHDSTGTTSRLRNRYGDVLLAFRDTLKAHNTRFVFVMYPSAAELRHGSVNLPWLERFAASHDIAALNLQAALGASQLPDTTLYRFPVDGHPGPTGYAIASDTLAKHMLAPGELAACRQREKGGVHNAP
jgi:hypothetical protein